MTGTEIAEIILAVATLLTSIGGFVVMIRKNAQTHELVNSNMEELKKTIAALAFKEGEDQEKAKQ